MILVDANLLVYACIDDLAPHTAAKSWLEERLNGPSRIGMPWPTLLGFLRIVTHPRIMARPVSIGVAWTRVMEWLDLPNVWVPAPTDRHDEILGDLLRASRATGNLVPDAHLAALAIEHGLTLCSSDGDFARFPGLRWENPLAD